MNLRLELVVAVTALGVAAMLPASAPAGDVKAPALQVYFLQGEQLVPVSRRGSTVRAAVTALLAGPTKAEAAKQFRSLVPGGTRLRSVRLASGVATVDLDERFAAGRNTDSLSARVAQLVFTATAIRGVKSVRVLIDGGVPLGLFPGITLSRPITRARAAQPVVPPPKPPPDGSGPVDPEVRDLQQRLADLGYLAPDGVDGVFGQQTRSAVIAFQKWRRVRPDGDPGPDTKSALETAVRPTPIRRGPAGHRVEVLLDRQLTLAIDGNVVVRVMHMSSGKPGFATPTGSFSVFRKEARSWSVPYKVWLPWATYFVGGVAFHEYPDVPVVPASHGCVRTPRPDARWLYDFTPIGTPVVVLGRS
jgi:sporulation and spore germination protein/L,D-transpeptidase-like protein/putative peptidoglycan binding protein